MTFCLTPEECLDEAPIKYRRVSGRSPLLPDHTASTVNEGGLHPDPEPPESFYGFDIESDAQASFPGFLRDGAEAGDVLVEAHEAVTQDRTKTHGGKERSFAKIAEFWSAYLGVPVNAFDVAMLMVLLKIGRAVEGNMAHRDHYVDIAGYAGVAWEIIVGGKA